MKLGLSHQKTVEHSRLLKNLILYCIGFVLLCISLSSVKIVFLIDKNIFKSLAPNLTSFVQEYVYNIMVNHFYDDYGYEKWEEKLYGSENLTHYSHLLDRLSVSVRRREIPALFILTPNSYASYFSERYAKIIPLLNNAGFEHLNLHPAVVDQLGHLPPKKLRANPADGHPGEILTELFSEEVLKHLEEHYLDLDLKLQQ